MAGTITRAMVEGFVDQLQEKGLGQLGDKNWGLNKWNSRSTFGFHHRRNQSFKTMVDSLVQPFKDGITLNNLRPANMTGFMEDYVSTYLTHHVMRCLLTAPNAQMPELQVNGLVLNMFKQPTLPQYSAQDIAAFQTRWTTLPTGRMIPIGTEVDAEQEVLSAILADRIIQIVQNIDVTAVVRASLKAYIDQKNIDERSRHGLFSDAGPAGLEAGRAEYTPEQQQHDFDNQVRADLRTAAPGEIAQVAAAVTNLPSRRP